jgi:hypothetical protein
MSKLEFTQSDGINFACLLSDAVEIKSTGDALDLMGNCYGRRTNRLILRREHFTPEFFDLRSGLLGEVLQKFTTYDFRLAIVGDFGDASKNMQDFIYESNKTGRIVFVSTLEEAKARLSR